MKNMIKAAGAASLLAMAVSSTTAVAAPLDYLKFSQNSGFKDGTVVFNPATDLQPIGLTNPTGANSPADTYEDFAWKGQGAANDPQSTLNIHSYDSNSGIPGSTNDESPSNGTGIPTSGVPAGGGDANGNGLWDQGEWWVMTELTQVNRILSGSSPAPYTWMMDAVANFYVFDPDDALVHSDLDSTTPIVFWETQNRVLESNCQDPNPLETRCDDIYKVSLGSFAPETFILDGYKYTINFGLAPGPASPGPESLVCVPGSCAGVDVPEGQVWVFTSEANPGTSSVYVTTSWTVAALVPEPSVLALFGLGALGLGLAGRRRKQQA